MTNRKLAYIVKDQKPLVLGLNETVQHACRLMWERRAGSVLIVDTEKRLRGIFTGRDAVATPGQRQRCRHDPFGGSDDAEIRNCRAPHRSGAAGHHRHNAGALLPNSISVLTMASHSHRRRRRR